MSDKVKCMIRGKIVSLSPRAYEMAKEYFGAQKISELTITKPILIPKIKVEKPEEIIKKVTEEPKVTKAPKKRTTRKK